MPNAAIYVRVSTEDQANEGYSLPSQIEAARVYAQQRGLVVHEDAVYRDEMSGTRLDRPGLAALRERVRAHELDAVIVYEVDRLSRKYAHQVLLREELRAYDVELHFAKLGQKSAHRAEERIGEDILALMAEIEREKLLERTQRGKQQKLKEGRALGSGYAPFGYQWAGNGKNKHLEIDEDAAQWVRFIFRQYAGGASVWDVTAELTAQQVMTPYGRLNRSKPYRGPASWEPTTIYRVLTNSVYIGEWLFNRHRAKGTSTARNYNSEEYVGVASPAIIEREIWDTVQARLVVGRRYSSRNEKRPDFLLARRVRCDCGGVWRAQVVKSVYGYYKCTFHSKHRDHRCARMPIRREKLDNRAWEYILETQLSAEWVRKQRELQNQQVQATTTERDSQKTLLLSRRQEITERIRRLVDMREGGEIDRELFVERKALRDEELRQINSLLAELDAAEMHLFTDEEIDDEAAFVERVRAGALLLTPSERRKVIEWLDVRLIMCEHRDELGFTLETAFTRGAPHFISITSALVTVFPQCYRLAEQKGRCCC